MSRFAAPKFAEPIPSPREQTVPISTLDSPHIRLLQAESSFYNQYTWCLNPFLTIRDVIGHLGQELDHLVDSDTGWQLDEICKNIYLLGCSILDSIDDYLLGSTYDFSKITTGVPPLGPIVSIAERLCNGAGQSRFGKSKKLARWKAQWQLALVRSLRLLLVDPLLDKQTRADIRISLGSLLTSTSLDALLHRRIRIPGALRSQHLTHFDILALGRKFTSRFPERHQSIAIMGLRTAGSYFAPVLRSYLESQNYRDVDSFTIRPSCDPSKGEMLALARCAAKRSTLVIMDESVDKGDTLLNGVQLAQRYSVERQKIVILVPIHPSADRYKSSSSYRLLSDLQLIPLNPDEWHKYRRLDAETEEFVKEYFQALGLSVRCVSKHGSLIDQFNERLETVSDMKGHNRLKRVYEVRLSAESGCEETRYVLAKSAGWGWLSYHAFLVGERLAQFVTPLLGLRSGILYTEWQHHHSVGVSEIERSQWIDRAASYIATRARTLRLKADPAPDLIFESYNSGLASLARDLCQAYGARPVQYLRRGRMRYDLSRSVRCPCPTLIDGKMRPLEWIDGNASLLKSDFEQHGLGKIELNMADPAYDLADATLTWQLSFEEEDKLVTRYIQESGDVNVAERLLVNKLIAGMRASNTAIANLEDPRLAHRSRQFNRDFITAWNFLVLHTMRYCAKLCWRPQNVRWRGPLLVLDVDGVLDRRVFGFPSITWAGIRAVSLLHSHDLAVVLNTARSIPELKHYCQQFGFLGGVAEYGAFAWDAASNKQKILVSEESLGELRLLAEKLRRIPGVFLNEDYAFSIRAYTFEGGITRALPTLLIQNLICDLKLSRLGVLQTFCDTAVVAKETDKGKGLLALLELVGQTALPTLAIGDSEADLPMFAVAKSSFAPGHISCRNHARAIGCYIDAKPSQPGLLNIVRHIIHPDKLKCNRCRAAEPPANAAQNLVLRVLQHADESQTKRFLRVMCDPMVMRSFLAK